MGVARYEFRVSTLGMMMLEAASNANLVKVEIQEILSLLPFQVEIVEHKEEPEDLHFKHTLYLKHPVFIDGSEIKNLTKWSRAIAFDEHNKLYQYNENENLNFADFINKERNEK